MSSERIKWIESWLDSVSERGYQPAFVTALALNGYSILHNTSHNAMEAGKDVIAAKKKTGRVYAYQLKGNSGTRYNVRDWQSGLEQLNQLTSIPVSSSITSTRSSVQHTPVLVTNGEVHEAVYAQLRDFNDPARLRRIGARPLEIIARGQLLTLLTANINAFWPTTLAAERNILKALSADEDSEIDPQELETVIKDTLLFHDKPSKRAAVERVWGAVLIAALYVGRWASGGNYFEVIRGYTLTLAHVYCYLEKHNLRPEAAETAIAAIREQIRRHLADLSNYVLSFKDKPLIDGNILEEFAFYHARKITLHALLACACFYFEEEEIPGFEYTQAREFFLRYKLFRFFDGEYLIPAALAVAWWLHRSTPGRVGDNMISSLAFAISRINFRGSGIENIPNPYYDPADVVLSRFR